MQSLEAGYAKVAINKGNSFIRISLFVVIGTLLRFAYDVFGNKKQVIQRI
jgi:hypothetical protein